MTCKRSGAAAGPAQVSMSQLCSPARHERGFACAGGLRDGGGGGGGGRQAQRQRQRRAPAPVQQRQRRRPARRVGRHRGRQPGRQRRSRRRPGLRAGGQRGGGGGRAAAAALDVAAGGRPCWRRGAGARQAQRPGRPSFPVALPSRTDLSRMQAGPHAPRRLTHSRVAAAQAERRARRRHAAPATAWRAPRQQQRASSLRWDAAGAPTAPPQAARPRGGPVRGRGGQGAAAARPRGRCHQTSPSRSTVRSSRAATVRARLAPPRCPRLLCLPAVRKGTRLVQAPCAVALSRPPCLVRRGRRVRPAAGEAGPPAAKTRQTGPASQPRQPRGQVRRWQSRHPGAAKATRHALLLDGLLSHSKHRVAKPAQATGQEACAAGVERCACRQTRLAWRRAFGAPNHAKPRLPASICLCGPCRQLLAARQYPLEPDEAPGCLQPDEGCFAHPRRKLHQGAVLGLRFSGAARAGATSELTAMRPAPGRRAAPSDDSGRGASRDYPPPLRRSRQPAAHSSRIASLAFPRCGLRSQATAPGCCRARRTRRRACSGCRSPSTRWGTARPPPTPWLFPVRARLIQGASSSQ